LATRTVTSYLLGGLSMSGTVSVVHDIFRRRSSQEPRAAGRDGRGECPAHAERAAVWRVSPALRTTPRRRGGHWVLRVPMLSL
jgi:hypothetical protein